MTRVETKQVMETVVFTVQVIVTLGTALLTFLNQRQEMNS